MRVWIKSVKYRIYSSFISSLTFEFSGGQVSPKPGQYKQEPNESIELSYELKKIAFFLQVKRDEIRLREVFFEENGRILADWGRGEVT